MNVNRILKIQGEAVDTLRQFLASWWKNVELDFLLAPVEQPDRTGVSVRILKDPEDLARVNPFAPMMLVNSAPMVERMIKDHPKKRLAAILRPCELRTLVELQKRQRNNPRSHETKVGYASESQHAPPSLTIIGVDCSGTFSWEEYARRVAAKGIAGLTHEALDYDVASGTMPLHIRDACDLCDRPAPMAADMVIGSLGVARLGYLLVIARDEEADFQLRLQASTDAIAAEEQVIQREFAINALVNHRASRRRKLTGTGIGSLDIILGQNSNQQDLWGETSFGSLLGLFTNCTLCADCLDACPLYDGELEGMLGINRSHQGGRPLLPELVGVSRWLVSCSGCGMCQEACRHSEILAQLISTISHRLRSELHYVSGDPSQPLPWR